MRKGYYTFMTLGLAGVIVFGGAGILSQKISSASTENIITTVKKGAETGGQTKDAEDFEGQVTEKKVFYKKYGIYLPESAEITEEDKDSLKILWNGCQFTYYTSVSETQNEYDMSIADAAMIAINSVYKFGKQDVTGKTIEMSLQINIPADDDHVYDDFMVMNRKNYGVRYYAVDISGISQHKYSLLINSITGEVFGYADYYDRIADKGRKEFESEELKTMEPEFNLIAKKFINEDLNLGEVKECNFTTGGLMETENICRQVFNVLCKTTENDEVLVTIDPSEKSVLCFEINPLDL